MLSLLATTMGELLLLLMVSLGITLLVNSFNLFCTSARLSNFSSFIC